MPVPFTPMKGMPESELLTIGMSFIGSKWDDKKLIGYAYAAEQLIQFKPTPNL